MAAFQFAANQILINYGEDVNLSDNEKKIHAYTVLREWRSAREQLHLGQLYNSERGIHLGEILWVNQQYNTLNVYKKLGVETGTIPENILEWNGSFDEFADDIHAQIPLILSSDLDTIEKELICSAKEHHYAKKNRYIMNLLEQPIESDISGLQDSQSLSPECTITSQKYMVMRMDAFWILAHYQPTCKRLNAKARRKTSTFCVRSTQLTSKRRFLTHWTALTVFGIFQTLTVNLQNLLTNRLMTESSIVGIL